MLFICSACYGNKVQINFVKKVDSLSSEILKRDGQINSLEIKIADIEKRIYDYEDFKGKSNGNDQAIWEYGSAIVGIMLGIIFIFGVIYYISSKQAARDAFDNQFENYVSLINKKVKQSNALLDILESRAGILDEGGIKLNDSLKSIEDGYSSENSST